MASQEEMSWETSQEEMSWDMDRELDEWINLDNVRDIDRLAKIPLTWIAAWEMDGRRGFGNKALRKKISKCI